MWIMHRNEECFASWVGASAKENKSGARGLGYGSECNWKNQTIFKFFPSMHWVTVATVKQLGYGSDCEKLRYGSDVEKNWSKCRPFNAIFIGDVKNDFLLTAPHFHSFCTDITLTLSTFFVYFSPLAILTSRKCHAKVRPGVFSNFGAMSDWN
jgi:hypothetical protein